jgi:DNA-binding MarR family transcriptional regulator
VTRSTHSSGDFTLAEYRALAEFRYQVRRFLHFSEEQARSSGLEPRQHQLLLAIKGLPRGRKATVGELASRMQLRHHSTVGLLDRLAGRGLVKRIRGEKDLREVLIVLTRSGGDLLRGLTAAHRKELETAGAELSNALRRVLRKTE